MLMFTEGVWKGSSRPQQASDPLKGSTVCLCRETRPPQLSHRVAEGRKRQFLRPQQSLFVGNQQDRAASQVGEPAQRTGLGTREIGVWGKVPPGTNYGFHRPISSRNKNKHFLFTLGVH